MFVMRYQHGCILTGIILLFCETVTLHAQLSQSVYGNATTRGFATMRGRRGVGNSLLNNFRSYSSGVDRLNQQYEKTPNPLRMGFRGNRLSGGLGARPHVDRRLKSHRRQHRRIIARQNTPGLSSLLPITSQQRRIGGSQLPSFANAPVPTMARRPSALFAPNPFRSVGVGSGAFSRSLLRQKGLGNRKSLASKGIMGSEGPLSYSKGLAGGRGLQRSSLLRSGPPRRSATLFDSSSYSNRQKRFRR